MPGLSDRDGTEGTAEARDAQRTRAAHANSGMLAVADRTEPAGDAGDAGARPEVPTLRRIAPALALLVLSPLVAEFLLGDFSVRQLGILPFLLPQYGGGALLVREATRRTGRGWPTMLLLALAYALVEEGFTTQSLFNPNYAGQRLLDYGYIPALGTSLHWAVFVLTLHVVWSVGSCVAIAEGLAGSRWRTPWLGRAGLSLTVVLFLAGCALTRSFTIGMYPFTASAAQLVAVAILIVAATLLAFGAFRGRTVRIDGSPPSPSLVGATTLVFSSSFHILSGRGRALGLHPTVMLVAMVALELIVATLLTVWSRRAGWGPVHALSAATGAVLTYGWLSLSRFAEGRTALGVPTTALDVAGQVVLLAVVLGTVWVAVRRSSLAG